MWQVRLFIRHTLVVSAVICICFRHVGSKDSSHSTWGLRYDDRSQAWHKSTQVCHTAPKVKFDSWTTDLFAPRYKPVNHQHFWAPGTTTAWPGADGNPISRPEATHGRSSTPIDLLFSTHYFPMTLVIYKDIQSMCWVVSIILQTRWCAHAAYLPHL